MEYYHDQITIKRMITIYRYVQKDKKEKERETNIFL